MKKLLCLFFMTLPVIMKAQVGIGTNTPKASAVLDVTSTTKGFLPPRMTQVQMNAVNNPEDGLIIYCTDCKPRGLYNYDTSVTSITPGWIPVGSSNYGPAAFAASTLNCTGTLSGTFTEGVAMNSSNSKILTITVTSTGSYSAGTNTANGVQFTGSGNILTAGANQIITLTASGTPPASGTYSYTVTLSGQTCNFSVTFAPGATFNCSTTSSTPLSPATALLVQNTAYTAAVTLNYTAGSGSSYGSTTITQSGLSLTRVAGTYNPGGGTLIYNLTGTYTGATTSGSITFNLPEGCSVSFSGYASSTVVNSGVDVINDGIKVTIPSSGNRSLQIGAVSGTLSVEYTSFQRSNTGSGPASNCTGLQTVTLNSTYTYINSSWNFNQSGQYQCIFLRNITTGRAYKITVIYGPSGNNNLIRFERSDNISGTSMAANVVQAGTSITLGATFNIQVPSSGNKSLFIAPIGAASVTGDWGGQVYTSGSGMTAYSNYYGGSYSPSGAYPITWSSGLSLNPGDIEDVFFKEDNTSTWYRLELAVLSGGNYIIREERLDGSNTIKNGQLVNNGTTVTFNNINAEIGASPNSLMLSTTSGTISTQGGTHVIGAGSYLSAEGVSSTLNTAYAYYGGSWSMGTAGDHQECYVYDSNASKYYRIIEVVAGGYSGNLLLIEQLY
ncbi:MAG: hypothetical protein JST86_10105 [Bacteroidetes bacterium]|nr:hypothetical protein [Bacteroidota bacterium]